MACKNRGDTSRGDTYHVTSEINRWLMDLQSPIIKTLFIQIIAEAHENMRLTCGTSVLWITISIFL
ncbi:MAG: hypothetical protein LBQ77_07915 [Treponema sp.]|jgi:hypothetical protein|nr:hypothetical protein [Treponema sp.]